MNCWKLELVDQRTKTGDGTTTHENAPGVSRNIDEEWGRMCRTAATDRRWPSD